MINLIEEENINPVTLSIELERAVLQHEAREDGSLYLTENGFFPIFIRVRKHSGLVSLDTYLYFRESATELERLKLANTMNQCAFGITCYVNDAQLKFDHILNYRNGLLRETFVRVVRNFSRVVGKSISEHDPGYQLLMPLLEMSAEKP